jgi:hypothetical protein
MQTVEIETRAASSELLNFQALNTTQMGVRQECRYPIIVRSRYIVGVARASSEADSPLLVDLNIVLAISVARQPLQLLPGGTLRTSYGIYTEGGGNVEIHPNRENRCLTNRDPCDGFPDPRGVRESE